MQYIWARSTVIADSIVWWLVTHAFQASRLDFESLLILGRIIDIGIPSTK